MTISDHAKFALTVVGIFTLAFIIIAPFLLIVMYIATVNIYFGFIAFFVVLFLIFFTLSYLTDRF